MEESSRLEQPQPGYKAPNNFSFIENKEAFEGWLACPSQPWYAYTAPFRPGPVATNPTPYPTQHARNNERETTSDFAVHENRPFGGQHYPLPYPFQREVAYTQPAYIQHPTGYVGMPPDLQQDHSHPSITVGDSSTATNGTSPPAQTPTTNPPEKESLTRSQAVESARSALEALIPKDILSRFDEGHSISRLARATTAHIRELQHQLVVRGFRDAPAPSNNNILPREPEPSSLTRRPTRLTVPRNPDASRRRKLKEEQNQAVGALDTSIPMRLRQTRKKGVWCARVFCVATEYILLLRAEMGRLGSVDLDGWSGGGGGGGEGGYQEVRGEFLPQSERGGELLPQLLREGKLLPQIEREGEFVPQTEREGELVPQTEREGELFPQPEREGCT